MEELSNLNVRSILVTSGTLSPLPSYSMELGLPFPHTLENPHIIQEDQVHVRVIGKGVSGKLLSSSYERRQDGEYYSELGNTLASLSKVIPAGMLIFFPSYGVMETCIERWGGPSLSRSSKPTGRNAFFAQRKKTNASKQYAFPRVAPAYNTGAFGSPSSPWKRLLAAKAIVVEPRASSDLPDAIAEFKRFLDMPKSSGCVLMGVCRGKISEGIDFAHDMSRAVIITGIPFAPSFDAKVKMKREFLDCARIAAASKPALDAGFGSTSSTKGGVNSKLSGDEWYCQQAHRAVNQAIGRVIRNRSDYGAVLLLDSRFDQPRNKEGLSRWVRPHVKSDEGFGPAVKALGEFYREAASQAKIRAEAKAAPVEIADEDDDKLSDDDVDDVKRVAIIASENSAAKKYSGLDIEDVGAYVAPDRIVARLDVDTVAQNQPKPAPGIVRKPVAARNFDAVFSRKSTGSSSAAPKKAAASIFMEKTRALLDLNDQSSIRKLIVTMKKQGDMKDVKGFRRSAGEIIRIILKAEKHESPPIANDERMLFLFLELVPQAYRADFQLVALQKIVETSSLGQQCKENLVAVDCPRVLTATVAALHLVWFKKDAAESSFVQHAQVVISAICKDDRVASQNMLRSFLTLLPKDRHEICRRLFEDIDIAKRMELRKQQQRNRVGESSIDMNRFLPASTVNKRTFGRLEGTQTENGGKYVPPNATNSTEMAQPKLLQAQQQSLKRVAVNPYKRVKTKSNGSTKASSSHEASESVTSKSKRTSLSKLLKSFDADPYVHHKKPSTAKHIKSNAPSGLLCQICSTQMSAPYIAKCGHMACLSCWRDWLKRSETCTTCRAPTSLDSIAIAVFQSHDKTTKPAQPEVGDRNHDEQANSEGELELY